MAVNTLPSSNGSGTQHLRLNILSLCECFEDSKLATSDELMRFGYGVMLEMLQRGVADRHETAARYLTQNKLPVPACLITSSDEIENAAAVYYAARVHDSSLFAHFVDFACRIDVRDPLKSSTILPRIITKRRISGRLVFILRLTNA